MTKLRSVFDPVVFSRWAPWAKKSGGGFKKYHNPQSAGQNLAQANLAETASRAYGSHGLVGGQPAVAVFVRANIPRPALPAGQAAANRQRSREMRHAAVPGLIQAKRAAAAAKGAGGGAGIVIPPGAYGGFPA